MFIVPGIGASCFDSPTLYSHCNLLEQEKKFSKRYVVNAVKSLNTLLQNCFTVKRDKNKFTKNNEHWNSIIFITIKISQY